jgi:hypothetical protein
MPHTDYRDLLVTDLKDNFQVKQIQTALEKLNEVFKKSFLRYMVAQMIEEMSEDE